MVKTKMAKQKTVSVKKVKVSEKKVEKEEEGGMSLDDAFAGDEDVEYAPSKPKKEKKKGMDEDELEDEVEEIEEKFEGKSSDEQVKVIVKASKPVKNIKKGDKIKVDGKELEVDAHYVLIDHGSTKEMTIELFDAKTDKDYQLRYFDDQVNETLDFYELQEILYVKRHAVKIEW